MFSYTYLGIIVSVLGAFLPRIGVELGTEELTTAVSVLMTIGGALWGLYGRYRLGGVSKLGFKK